MALPRAGEGQEIYIFPTVTVPPTAASQEYGLEPGFPSPAATNRTRAHLGIVGSMRDPNAAKLPIRITVQGVAAFKQGLQAQVDRALNTNTTKIYDIIRQVRRGQLIGGGAPVPRFSIERPVANTDPQQYEPQLGIDPDFSGTSFDGATTISALTAPAGYATVTGSLRASSAPLCLDYKGRLICCYLIRRTSGGDAGKHRILAYTFDQAVDTDWRQVVSTTEWDNPSPTWITSNGSVLINPHLTTVLYRGDIYAIIADAVDTGNTTGSVLVYRLQMNNGDPPWFFEYVTGPIQMGTTLGIIADGGITAAALPDRVVVAVGGYASAGIGFRQEARAIWVGQSTDMVKWSETTDSGSGFVALDPFAPALPLEADGTRLSQRVNRVRMYTAGSSADDRLRGWAVTDGGRIYATTDGGVNWSQQTSPVTVPLYDVQIIQGSTDQITVYACGASGCLLMSADSGATWAVYSIATTVGDTLDRTVFWRDKHFVPEIGDGPLYAMAWVSDSAGWVVGKNKIAFVRGLQDAWRAVEPQETDATYTSIIVMDPNIDFATILVGGSIQRQRNKATKDLKRYRFLKITHANKPDPAPSSNYSFHSEIDNDSFRIEAIAMRSATEAYACGRGGTLFKSTNLNASPPTWTQITTPGKHDLMDIVFRQGLNSGTPDNSLNEFLIATADGLLLRSVCNGEQWVLQHVGGETIGGSVAAVTLNVEDDNESVVLIAAGTGLWRADLGSQYEAIPSLLALNNSELLLATADLGKGQITLRRSQNRGQSFSAISLDESESVTFTPQTTFLNIQDTTLRPCLASSDTGELLLTAGSGGKVSPDGRGEKWVASDDPQLMLPLGALTITSAATQNRSRLTIAYGGGRLFTVSQNGSGQWETRVARDYSASAIIFNPVIPTVAQWIGVDDVRVVFSGTNLPVGESWTINPEYRYPKSNLVAPTRALWWRGNALTFGALTTPIVFTWDRQDTDVVAALGAGTTWNFTAGCLFGVNFRRAMLAVSTPEYTGSTFPADTPASYTEFTLSADLEEGILSLAPNGTAAPINVLVCQGKTWIPDQWRPGIRTYYVEVNNGVDTYVYTILGNTENALIVNRDENTTVPLVAGNNVVILADRMVTLGDQGTRGGITGRPPLIEGTYQFGRHLRLTIPGAQWGAGGYLKIEALCLGRHIPTTIKQPDGQLRRDRYSADWRWAVRQGFQLEDGLYGETAVESFGNAKLFWSLPYRALQERDAFATLHAALNRNVRDPFAIVFDDQHPTETLEWVRIRQLPEIAGAGESFLDVPLEIEAV